MKKVLLIFLTLFLLVSCDVNEEKTTTGSLAIYISSVNDRIIEPDFDDEIYCYSVYVTNVETSEVISIQNTIDDIVVLNDLEAGEWDIYAVAKNKNGAELSSYILESFYLRAEETNTAYMVLEPIKGEGSLDIYIEWTGELDSINSLDISLESADSVVLDVSYEVVGNKMIITKSGLESGYYLFSFVLDTNLFYYNVSDAIRIINEETTVFNYVVPENRYW